MKKGFDKLISIIRRLRGPGGCPWDKAQTLKSMKPYLVEETYEVIDAIEEGKPEKIKEELGDLLMQVLLQSQIAEEEGLFTIDEVLKCSCKKLIRRHPHIFGEAELKTEKEVIKHWEAIKKQERKFETKEECPVFGRIPKSSPALFEAIKAQEKASRNGLFGLTFKETFSLLISSINTLKEAQDPGKKRQLIGEILFLIVNISRLFLIDPENALRRHSERFKQSLLTNNNKDI
jgi:tetrapyrrole methylase family protein/MazG family protein